MDATAILDYFAPLKQWLDEQNKGHKIGWYRRTHARLGIDPDMDNLRKFGALESCCADIGSLAVLALRQARDAAWAIIGGLYTVHDYGVFRF